MDDLFKKKPFHIRHEFLGTLSKGSGTVHQLQIVVQYSQLKVGKIRGIVYGRVDTSKRLSKISAIGGPYWELRSDPTDENKVIGSKKVLVKQIMLKTWPKEISHHMVFEVADLEFYDLEIVEKFGDSESTKEREITFFLSGPRELWHVYGSRDKSYTGDIKVKIDNSRFDLIEDLPFDVEITPNFIFEDQKTDLDLIAKSATDELPESHEYEITTDILSVVLKTKKSMNDLSNEDFLALGQQVVNDLTLLVSLISQHWVTWYIYNFYSNQEVRHYVRATRKGSTAKINPEDSLVNWSKTREFIRTAYSKNRQLREKNINLFMPILNYVSANDLRFIEEKFTTLFIALEKLKDIYAIEKDYDKNMKSSSFRKLKKVLSSIVDNNIQDSKQNIRLKDKLPELNRPTFRFVLDKLLDEYEIEWKDLYPPRSKLTLIKTRDILFHSSKDIDIDLLWKDCYRLQALVGRILLRFLDWEDLSNSPNRLTKLWLNLDSLPNNSKLE